MVLAAMMVGSKLAGKVEGHYVAGSRYESMSDSTTQTQKARQNSSSPSI
jgi:hypothetical protein